MVAARKTTSKALTVPKVALDAALQSFTNKGGLTNPLMSKDRVSLLPQMTPQEFLERFKPAVPPPGALPRGMAFDEVKKQLAMDEVGGSPEFNTWMSQGWGNLAFVEGYTFMGYPYLSQLAQISEYRQVSETIAAEATRKYIKIKSKSGAKDKDDKIDLVKENMKRLGMRAAFQKLAEHDGFFGRAHLYLDTGDTDNPNELKTPLGDAMKKFGKKKGWLKALRVVEPVWTYPSMYDAQDPLKGSWYKPQMWFVNGKEVHVSRLLTFVAREVPDLFKPAFSFGGLSLTQMIKPYVDNWLQTRQSVNNIILNFSVMVLKTDLSALIMTGGADLKRRIDMFKNYSNNQGVMAISKNDEDFANVSASLASLDKLQAQAQEHMAAPPRIPLIKLLGITPSGLNASSEGELIAFEDNIHGFQENFYEPHHEYVFRLVVADALGGDDPDIIYEWEALREMTPKEKAEINKIKGDNAANLVDKGILDPAEPRKAMSEDEDSDYHGIPPDDVPDPPEEEEGIEPGNAKEVIKKGEGGGEGDD